MDSLRPWIINAFFDGPLQQFLSPPATSSTLPPPLLPLLPFRSKLVQFIRFYSPHRPGSLHPIWAQVSDRQVSILIYLSSQIIAQFEADQMADTRPLSQLAYPTFSLGGCRWTWDRPPPPLNHLPQSSDFQLCLKPVLDLPNKSFRFSSIAHAPFPSLDLKSIVPLHHLLNLHPPSNLLIRRLQITLDPTLSVLPPISSSVSILIPHPGPTKRAKIIRHHKKRRRSIHNALFLPAHKSILLTNRADHHTPPTILDSTGPRTSRSPPEPAEQPFDSRHRHLTPHLEAARSSSPQPSPIEQPLLPDSVHPIASSSASRLEGHPEVELTSPPRPKLDENVQHLTVTFPAIDHQDHLDRYHHHHHPRLTPHVRPQSARSSSDHHRPPIVLKIKGRRLSKYLDYSKPIVHPSLSSLIQPRTHQTHSFPS